MVLLRIGLGIGAAVIGTAFAGPAGAYGAWKLAGFVVSGGSPIYLVPGGTLIADGHPF